MPKHVVLYTAPMCGDCEKLKTFMDAHDVPYELRDIKKDPAHARELERQTGKQGVPYLVVDGNWVRGYEPRTPFTEDFARRILGL
jgi:glutaredoxin